MTVVVQKQVTREEFILSFHPLVCSIANKLKIKIPNTVDVEDMITVGMIGLIEAYDRFERTRGIPFAAYAELRVRGAMFDMLRQQDWVPRTVRKRVRDTQQFRNWFIDKHQRKPTPDELAGLLGVDTERLEKRMGRDIIQKLVSVEESVGQSGSLSLGDILENNERSIEENMVNEELRSRLMYEISQLADREKTTIERYYFHNQSLRSIGLHLGVTESRVCQIRGQAVHKLRVALKRNMFLD